MPKLKTKSSAKKRFKFSATGKLIAGQANKQHNMRKRSKRQLRNNRGTTVLCESDVGLILSYMPYNRKIKKRGNHVES